MSHKTKTYRAYWIGRDRWGLLNREDDITVDTRPFYECRTDELEPDSYEIQRREYGDVVEVWKTRDGAKLRDHLTQLPPEDDHPRPFHSRTSQAVTTRTGLLTVSPFLLT